MKGYNEFIELFGNIRISELIVIFVALWFLIKGALNIYKTLTKKHDEATEKEKKLNESYDAAENLPGYRAKSKEIQKDLYEKIDALAKKIDGVSAEVADMKKTMRKRDLNKTRDRLIRAYNYYTNPELNPSHSWTEMEAEAFWKLFEDYEEDGGDGFMHTEVEPSMRALTVIKMGEKPATKRTYIT